MTDNKAKLMSETFKSVIIPKKYTADIMKFMTQTDTETHIPSHFKRVKPYNEDINLNEILICNESLLDEGLALLLLQKVTDHIKTKGYLEYKIETRYIPTNYPDTKDEFEVMMKIWPMTYIPKKEPELNNEEINLYKGIIHKEYNYFDLDMKQSKNFAMIIDSDEGEALIKKRDEQQHGKPLDHLVIQAINDYSEKYLITDKKRYLLTNLVLITRIEPCMMCAMALVHSRIKKVIYIENNINYLGALNKDLNINNLGVNHKYEVFKYDKETDTFMLIR